MIYIKLTAEQAKTLSNHLWKFDDCGPRNEGWASKKLDELRDIVDLARTNPLKEGSSEHATSHNPIDLSTGSSDVAK